MRSTTLVIGLVAAFTAAAPAFAAPLTVAVDQSRRVSLSGSAANVVVGNPAIADVTLIDRRNLLVTGKGYGSTSLMVMDELGRTIFDRAVLVGADGTGVTVQRGLTTYSYSCTPACAPGHGGGGGGTGVIATTAAGGSAAPAGGGASPLAAAGAAAGNAFAAAAGLP